VVVVVRYIIGIDTGGTFTDVTLINTETNQVFIDKASTTPDDFSEGVMNAIGEVAKWVDVPRQRLLSETRLVKHGSTVATNALINRAGSRVGLITTAGFEDTTLIMRAVGRVAGLSTEEIKHQATAVKPPPLVPKTAIYGVTERIDFQGRIIIPLNEAEVREAIRSLVENHEVEAIAVSLLWGFVNPQHERRIREIFETMYPDRADIDVTLTSELVPVFREYARTNTVVINSFLARTVNRYVTSLNQKLGADGYASPLLMMQSNGGIVHRDEMTPVGMLQSGPCGGIIASKTIADLLGHANVISTDMGGTSFDVGLLTDGFWSYMREPVVERYHITWPIIDIESIGAGGGTLAHFDPVLKRLLVGPKSAGAQPGPVCYGRGGMQPTVTDADLILGYLDPAYFLGGRMRLDRAGAEDSIRTQVAEPMGMSAVEAACGIYDIVNAHMSDLLRKKIIPTGKGPDEFVLYAFGGAGPAHAAAFTVDTGIRSIYVFPTSAVFSSYGIAAADVMHTLSSSYRYLMPMDPAVLNSRLLDMDERLLTVMDKEGFDRRQITFRRTFYMRYRRQLNELPVHVPAQGYGNHEHETADVAVASAVREYDESDVRAIMSEFERRYEEVYGPGSGYTKAGIEVISISVDAIGPAIKPTVREYPPGQPDPSAAFKGRREVYFGAETRRFLDTPIYDYLRLQPSNHVAGPAVIETPITTIVVPPGASGTVDRYLNIALRFGS
jgi:N-methylhydantoinase A